MEHGVVQTEADRYVIVEYIAEGGMGAIFLGKKIGMEGFEKEVVLKQLLPEFTSQPEFIDLFLREAKLSASLDHANIVNTIDLVAAEEDYFIVMEYVHGGDLRTILRRIKQQGHQLRPAAALFIARELLSALAYAHDKRGMDGKPLNLIHRDISPSNIMLSAAGEVKLTDFGIAKVSTHKSVFYRVKGKVGYMSPEQAYADRPIDRRADLYAVAICLHEMLSGQRLFIADLLSTPDQIYGQKIPLLETSPEIPKGIDTVLQRALARDPDQRYQSALDLQDALMKVAFDNGLLFAAPDLASHLREVCGPDPSRWNKEDDAPDEPAGTEVLSSDVSAEQAPAEHVSAEHLSRVEFTSIFNVRDVTRTASGLEAPPLGSASEAEEPTRHHVPSPHSIEFDATRLAPGPAFDVSDSGFDEDDDEEETVLAASAAPTAAVPLASGPFDGRQGDSALLEQLRGVSNDLDRWPDDSTRGEDLETVAGGPHHAKNEADADNETPLPRSAVEAMLITSGERPVPEDDTTLEVKLKQARRAAAARAPRRPDLDQIRIEPATAVSIVAPPPRRHRLLLVLAALLLLGSGVAIVVLVGLSGPELGGDGAVPVVALRDDAARPSTADAAGATSALAPDLSQGDLAAPRPVLKLSSSPADAKVYVDGKLRCTTPCVVDDLEEQQVHLLSLRRKRYLSWSSLVDLKGQRMVRINAYLTEEPNARSVGYLTFSSTPAADVYIDGKEIGRVTTEGRIPLPPGQYEVTLRHPRKKRQLKFLVEIEVGVNVALSRTF